MSMLLNTIKNTSPSELAKIRGRRIETSTRDKKRLLTKVAQIQSIIEKLGYEIEIKKRAGKK